MNVKIPSMTDFSPTCFIIFGATGDLSQKKLLPALFDLYKKNILPKKFQIIAFSRRPYTNEIFRDFIRESLGKNEAENGEEVTQKFLEHVFYQIGQFENKESYQNLSKVLHEVDLFFETCSNKLFYLATPPEQYQEILNSLSHSGLTIPCGGNLGWTPLENQEISSTWNREAISQQLTKLKTKRRTVNSLTGWTRILVEKPFGRDTKTALALDVLLKKLFNEDQIFRIDHYLAKESLQNILTFRFSNPIFEGIWDRKHISHVHISLYEKNDVEHRIQFYKDVGALRDVGQNHILQMLALSTMERPKSFEYHHVREARGALLKTVGPFSKKQVKMNTVRAQYKGFLESSDTETYFFLKTFIRNKRWKDVPFYLESGKGMKESKSEISFFFKNTSSPLSEKHSTNVLTFRIQPDEGITLRFSFKKPAFEMEQEEKTLSFSYREATDQVVPDAYERVLLDAIRGDQTLFSSTEEVLASWKFVSSILDFWKNQPMQSYVKGSDGPENALRKEIQNE